jgi:hypothetical protein
LTVAGCAQKRPHIAAVEPPQALDVPPPPPRVIVPPQPEPLAAVEEQQPASPTRPRPPRTAPRADAKNEPRPETTTPEPRPATPEAPPEKPNQDLQPVDAAGETAIRQQIGRARQDLNKVDYAALSNDLKTQYDTANRFLTLSEQALKEHNLLFASTLADKAGAIAALLTRR